MSEKGEPSDQRWRAQTSRRATSRSQA